MSEELLKVQNLKKFFQTPGGSLHAVDDVSFSINEASTLGVVGESGCGKSTLGRTLLRLNEPTSGEIWFHGQDVVKASKREMSKIRPKMQMIFQDPYSSLNGRMTVKQLIAEPLIINKICHNKSEQEDRVMEAMKTVGLAQRLAFAYPHELDGGRRQRIGIARALILNPEFIVCDEPVSALDVSIQAQILNLLMDLQEQVGLTYVFITHNMSVVRHISDNICVMYLGQLIETCPTKELFTTPLHPYTKALLSAIPSTDITKQKEQVLMKGELTSPINPVPGCRFYARCDHSCEKCLEPQSLQELLPEHFVSCCRARELNQL